MQSKAGIVEYMGIREIRGPLVIVRCTSSVAYDELVEVVGPDGKPRLARVIEVGKDYAVVQVFEGTSDLPLEGTRVRFLGTALEIPVSMEMLGRVLNGRGEPMDGLLHPITDQYKDVNGVPMNPSMREYPVDYIQTGISVIDQMLTLVRGQKLPIFTCAGLTHNVIAAQIARQASIPGRREEFAVIFAAIGVKYDEAMYFRRSLEESGAIRRSTLVLNLAEDPVIERIITPRIALTIAEYLAYEKDMHVLIILTDMTNYCEALREVSAAREEVPGRRGYPGYMYTDLASIYERAGRIKGKKGSITQIPILTMPADDITHPIPDLTGYVTEGQVTLSRVLHGKGIYPPVDILMSLSRLMKDGIGRGKTREDHADVFSQLSAAYRRAQEVRDLATLAGEAALSPTDKQYLEFGNSFERIFLSQGVNENRSIEGTLNLAWHVLSILPDGELTRIRPEYIQRYLKREK